MSRSSSDRVQSEPTACIVDPAKCPSRSIITVTLRNSGSMAFKPDDYPEQIVIERTIERSGASSYKIRATRDGRIVARKKQEMNEIVTHFNISVDSPATVLTQDEARSFLTNHDESKLYDVSVTGALCTRSYRRSSSSTVPI